MPNFVWPNEVSDFDKQAFGDNYARTRGPLTIKINQLLAWNRLDLLAILDPWLREEPATEDLADRQQADVFPRVGGETDRGTHNWITRADWDPAVPVNAAGS